MKIVCYFVRELIKSDGYNDLYDTISVHLKQSDATSKLFDLFLLDIVDKEELSVVEANDIFGNKLKEGEEIARYKISSITARNKDIKREIKI